VARSLKTLALCTVLALSSASHLRAQSQAAAYSLPRGLQDNPFPVPEDNKMTPGKIALGEQLFFDKRLSKSKTMSCESCHVPEKGWTDGQRLSKKDDGSVNVRHTPTLYEVAYAPDLYWDGRAKGLEAQILAAWKGQMSADPEAIGKELDAIPAYKKAFEAELGGPPTGDRIVKALATFVRTIHAADTEYDRLAADPKKLEKSDVGKGFKVFGGDVARCSNCHLPPVFTDTLFHNVGIGFDTEKPDLGRGKHLTDAAEKKKEPVPADAESMKGAFKTPTLRGIALSGPYFHDGRAETLEQAVDFMLAGGIKNPQLDGKLQPAKITPEQRRQLLAFLKALTPEAKHPRPTGDRLNFVLRSDGEVVLRPAKGNLRDLAGILHRKGQRAVSIEDMDAAIARLLGRRR
jgi:cytochrome c peroxidase